MPSLERLPNGLYLAPSTAALYRAAGSPRLTNGDSAWRSKADQQRLRNDWLTGRGPYAAPPGSSNHEKGAAFDVAFWSARARCLAVGLIPDRDEWWHFNDPNAHRLPVIRTLAGAAGSSATQISVPTVKKDTDMAQLIRVSTPTGAYTEAVLTDYIHTKVIPAAEARAVMYCRADLDNDNGFDAVVSQSIYDWLKGLPKFPVG